MLDTAIIFSKEARRYYNGASFSSLVSKIGGIVNPAGGEWLDLKEAKTPVPEIFGGICYGDAGAGG